MGEHPPLLTPQGPGVSRARRPGFPRVDDSDTSRVSLSFPDSWWIAPPFAASASSPASRRFFSRPDTGSSTGLPALVALVFPSVSFPFLASGSLRFVPHSHDPGSFSSPYARVSPQLLSRSPLPCVRFLRFRCRCFHVHRRSSSFPISFRITVLPPRFRGSVLWPASRAEAPSHHSPGAARNTGS